LKHPVRDVRELGPADLKGLAVVHLAALSNDPLGDLNADLTYDINHRASVRLGAAYGFGVALCLVTSSPRYYERGRFQGFFLRMMIFQQPLYPGPADTFSRRRLCGVPLVIGVPSVMTSRVYCASLLTATRLIYRCHRCDLLVRTC
jgi:hypothetical protein